MVIIEWDGEGIGHIMTGGQASARSRQSHKRASNSHPPERDCEGEGKAHGIFLPNASVFQCSYLGIAGDKFTSHLQELKWFNPKHKHSFWDCCSRVWGFVICGLVRVCLTYCWVYISSEETFLNYSANLVELVMLHRVDLTCSAHKREPFPLCGWANWISPCVSCPIDMLSAYFI